MSVLASEQMRETVQALLAALEADVEAAARTQGASSPIIAELRQIIEDIKQVLRA